MGKRTASAVELADTEYRRGLRDGLKWAAHEARNLEKLGVEGAATYLELAAAPHETLSEIEAESRQLTPNQ